MDAQLFDRLTRALRQIGTRRGLLGTASALPILGGLVPVLDREGDAAANGRRKRRMKAHKHGKGRRQRRHKCNDGAPGGACIPLENLCAPLTNPCCRNTECVKLIPSKFVWVGTCQSRSCTSNQECATRFPNQDVRCETDPFKCSGIRGSCCLPQQCIFNDDCAHSGLCCTFFGESHCCAPGQKCTITGCLSV